MAAVTRQDPWVLKPPQGTVTGQPGGRLVRYGLRNGHRGRFAMHLPPLLEALSLAELTHEPRDNRMRAI